MVRGTRELTAPGRQGEGPIAGIVPAAGYGTRLGAAGSKEVQPVGGRPVMDHLIERMRAGGASEIRVVTRPDKTDVIANCEALGAEVISATPDSLGASFAAGLDGLGPERLVLIGFPDSIWAPLDGYRQLLEQVRAGFEVALGLFGAADVELQHVATLDPASGAVSALEVLPHAEGEHLTWECAAARAGALAPLASGTHPTDVIAALIPSGAVAGTHLSDECVDVGTPGGMRRARERYG